MALSRRIGRIAAWLVAALAVLIAAVVVFILTFDWNRARPYINDKVSEAIGRPFAIEGDLKVGWRHPAGETGWHAWVPWPRFSATNITVANPDWSRQKHFATLDEIDFQVKVLPLLAHDIVIPAINLVNPSVDLERRVDGRNNWTFTFASSTGSSGWKLDLHDIQFAAGHVAYSDEQKKADVQVAVDTLGQPVPIGDVMKAQENASRSASAQVVGKEGANRLAKQVEAATASEAAGASAASASHAVHASDTAAQAASAATSGVAVVASAPAAGVPATSAVAVTPETKQVPLYGIGWTVKGTYNRTVLSGSGKVGGVLALQDANRPFPVQADVKVGDTRIAVVGTVTDPAHLAAVDLRLWLLGASAAHLYSLTGVPLPETPPYTTEGRLIGQFRRNASVFKYENFTGRVGGSDLNGSLTWFAREPRPLLQGELVSNLLQFSDLAPIIGADSSASKAKRGDAAQQPPDRALPVEEFHTDRWNAIDADVKFTGRRIIKDPGLPITDLYAHVVMTDGVLSLEPLKFGVAGGTLASDIRLDGGARPLKGRVATEARHLKLRQLFPNVKTMQTALGEINGDAALSATGNSPAALAATSNGEVKALITDGTVSRLYMEAAGLNVANVVYEKLFGNRDVKINCAAANLVATNGVLDSKVFALDTDDAVINMDGHVDLRDESMDLNIHPHTKGLRVFTLRSPLYVKGTFKDPHVGVNVAALAVRGGAMVGLGLINPFAALIPLIAPSNNKPLPCDDLLAQMRAQPHAPPAGQKMSASRSADAAASAVNGARRPVAKKPAPAPVTPPSPPPSPEPAVQYKGS